ncbi:hypothetical protein BGZ75_003123 [Mortierella antarctica]|nr:hypothetical protein BGZ75_003123 [Mortierella antarctica]
MANLTLKIAAAVVLAFVSAQAAPLERRLLGSDCYQSASSGNVDISSTTNIAPVTEVTPITRYQPYVQTFAPIVDSECDYGGHGYLQGYGGHEGYGGYGGYGGCGGYGGYGAYGRGYRGTYGRMTDLGRRFGTRFQKREDVEEKTSGSLLFSQFQSQEACDTSVPAQTVDMGSQVNIQPTNQVLPETTYQNRVQALDTNIDACAAESSALPQQNVNLGSHVSIQPTTHVNPDTTYQPTVNQLTTSIDAAPQQDQSLPQSSVQLGSSVNIAPEVHVQPLTTFQSSVKSLPFIINAEPCVSSYPSGRAAYAAAGARASASASAIASRPAGMAGLRMAHGQGQIQTQSMA